MYYLLILYLLYFFGRAIRKFMASDDRTAYFIMACAMACVCYGVRVPWRACAIARHSWKGLIILSTVYGVFKLLKQCSKMITACC